MIKIAELYVKKVKGQAPEKVQSITLLGNVGVSGDIFAKGGERQVSLLLSETKNSILQMRSDEPCLKKFSCNIVLDGCELSRLKVGASVSFSGAQLEITEIGRQCHGLCELGQCPLTDGAIFARVLSGGEIKIGDEGQL